MNDTVRISFEGTDLSSRTYGHSQRNKIEKYLEDGNNVTVDLRNVETISHSFADELFAVLYSRIGQEKFYEKLNFIVKKKDIIQVISDSIRERNQLQRT